MNGINPAPLIQLEAVQFCGVLPENFLLVLSANVLKVLGDFFPRVGPERRAVGKVGRPEQVLHADIVAMGDAETVVDEGRIELAAEILARLEGQLGRKSAAVHANAARLEALVQAT